MQLWPAIDLIDGKCVRLLQGDYAQKTEYDFSLASLAKEFSLFATGIHVVDLDGAKAGKPINTDAIAAIVRSATIPVEVGGGVRRAEDIEMLLSLGVFRVILGTKAIENPAFIDEMVAKFGAEKIVIGVDAKGGMIATHGWEAASAFSADDFIALLEEKKVKTIIFTDIATDGTLAGPPFETFSLLAKKFKNLEIIASGGVSCVQDIVDLQNTGVAGSVFGKAWYEHRITKEQLLQF